MVAGNWECLNSSFDFLFLPVQPLKEDALSSLTLVWRRFYISPAGPLDHSRADSRRGCCHPFPAKEVRPICPSSQILRILLLSEQGTAELRSIAINSIDQQDWKLPDISYQPITWYDILVFAYIGQSLFFSEIALSGKSTRNGSCGREFYMGKQAGLSFTGT